MLVLERQQEGQARQHTVERKRAVLDGLRVGFQRVIVLEFDGLEL